MSIDSQRKSDIFQRLLESQKKPKSRLSNIVEGVHSDHTNEYNCISYQGRNSDIVGQQCEFEINHECTCFNQCLHIDCPCFLAIQQICIKGSCCILCIQYKNNLLRINKMNNNNMDQSIFNYGQQEKQIQQIQQQIFCNCRNTECIKSYCKCFQKGGFCSERCGCESCKNKPNIQQRINAINALKISNQPVFCTCKKTKCNKKYCSCYNSGVKCSKMCSCENCENYESNNHQMQIEIYAGDEHENYQDIEMPERMSFQPVSFQ